MICPFILKKLASMIKVYANEAPKIIMEGTNSPDFVSWDLQAYDDEGKVSIRRTKHNNRIIAWQVEHTEFIDANGDIFGNLQETIDALNIIFSSNTDHFTKSEVLERIHEHRKVKFSATAGQVNFDMGQTVEQILEVSRNGIDLDPSIFSMTWPYIVYNENANGWSSMRDWDILIVKFI